MRTTRASSTGVRFLKTAEYSESPAPLDKTAANPSPSFQLMSPLSAWLYSRKEELAPGSVEMGDDGNSGGRSSDEQLSLTSEYNATYGDMDLDESSNSQYFHHKVSPSRHFRPKPENESCSALSSQSSTSTQNTHSHEHPESYMYSHNHPQFSTRDQCSEHQMPSPINIPHSATKPHSGRVSNDCLSTAEHDKNYSSHPYDAIQLQSRLPSTPTPHTAGEQCHIVAPNVERLAATSIVEVQLLQYVGSEEKVSVMCSIDVLKMRSEYFYDLLCEQDRLGFTERACGGITNTTGAQSSRPPIIITEASPFEAAAFFESLHEGRINFKGEWNACWARLSVYWRVKELLTEYAHQIGTHFHNMLTLIRDHHWRTNPQILLGMKVSVFRKSNTPMPVVLSGIVHEWSTTGNGVPSHNASSSGANMNQFLTNTPPTYSKIRVLFDVADAGVQQLVQHHAGNTHMQKPWDAEGDTTSARATHYVPHNSLMSSALSSAANSPTKTPTHTHGHDNDCKFVCDTDDDPMNMLVSLNRSNSASSFGEQLSNSILQDQRRGQMASAPVALPGTPMSTSVASWQKANANTQPQTQAATTSHSTIGHGTLHPSSGTPPTTFTGTRVIPNSSTMTKGGMQKQMYQHQIGRSTNSSTQVAQNMSMASTTANTHSGASSPSRRLTPSTPSGKSKHAAVVGEITEPFWVKANTSDNNVWQEPDELFFTEWKHLISANDKRMFWEMATAVMDMPILSSQCTSGLSCSSDLAVLMKRPEYRILWTAEAPELLPKDVACEIISTVCVSPSTSALGNYHPPNNATGIASAGKAEG